MLADCNMGCLGDAASLLPRKLRACWKERSKALIEDLLDFDANPPTSGDDTSRRHER